MQREKGYRAPGSHVGRPHGGDKKRERQARAQERLAQKAATGGKGK